MLTESKVNEVLAMHMPRMKGVMCDHWMKKNNFPKYVVLAMPDSPFISSVEAMNRMSEINQRFPREADGSYLIPCDQLPPFLSERVVQQTEECLQSGSVPLIVASGVQVCVAAIRSAFGDFYKVTLPEAVANAVKSHRQNQGHRTDVVVIFHPDSGKDEENPNGDDMIIVPLLSSEVENDMFRDASGKSIEEIRETIAAVPVDRVAVILIFPDYMMVKQCPRPIDPSLN